MDYHADMAVDATLPSRWKRHLQILLGLAFLSLVLSLVVWLHPSLGYAQGGILDGADLRGSLVRILWWLFLILGLTASVVVRLLPPTAPRAIKQVAPYVLGLVVAALSIPIIDKYY